MKTQTTQTTQGKKPQRFLRLAKAIAGESVRRLTLTVGKDMAEYDVSEMECPFGGRAFRCEKVAEADANNVEETRTADTGSYIVRIDGEDSACECWGFMRWKHCKHVDALAKLMTLEMI